MPTSAAQVQSENERSLLITADDLDRLRAMIERAKLRDPRSSARMEALEGELSAARVVASSEVPADVVTLHSQVRLRDLDSGEEMVFTLVLPDEADVDRSRLSVLAPIGTAVLGYRAGDTFYWQVPDGLRHLRLLEVLYQPEASGQPRG